MAIRILRVNISVNDGFTEIWARVSGKKQFVESYVKALTKAKGIYFQLIYANSFGRILRILVPREYCKNCIASLGGDNGWCCCPLLSAPVGSMAKTTIITPCGAVYELVVSKRSVLEKLEKTCWDCELILTHAVDEYDYMLTEKQERILIEAYLRGYFSFPRKISMKDLAKELGMSVSSLAELLRKAEAKVVEAFVRHELPHYLVEHIIRRGSETSDIVGKHARRTPKDTHKAVEEDRAILVRK
ncbi:helix-turn-helix domain-containing protein [Pyrolobus fumarii]|uniref:helix-turn-helix domain-containing protein n=1 Tax=Pyrolobus fumarii TaxID=54252 RepID=UPI00064E7C70|nr:helix-turn-helix domain-containing protein [Pyrolobus fumarii]